MKLLKALFALGIIVIIAQVAESQSSEEIIAECQNAVSDEKCIVKCVLEKMKIMKNGVIVVDNAKLPEPCRSLKAGDACELAMRFVQCIKANSA